MEAQCNHTPELASIRYTRVWADFSALVQSGQATTLSSYCRITHTSYEGINYWLRTKGLSVKSLKKSNCTRDTALIAGSSEIKPVSFIQFAPSSAPMTGDVFVFFPRIASL